MKLCTESCERHVFYGSLITLASIVAVSAVVVVPVLLQMVLYTFPIIYVGSHLSLKQAEVDIETGEKPYKAESMSNKDAMLFPLFGSAALLSLYVAYRFLDAWYVNMLLTGYLTVLGVAATAETLSTVASPFLPLKLRDESRVGVRISFWPIGTPEVPFVYSTSWSHVIGYIIAVGIAVSWVVTKHWILHNIFAICFCIQAIALVSVGSFTVAAILLVGLFFYDIFWVFGTEVMVTVAKAFEGPAKLIFPVNFSPWQQSILGLGDVVIPGIFISMCLRFDSWMNDRLALGLKKKIDGEASEEVVEVKGLNSIDIHAKFGKFYFWVVIMSYELGLITTGIVMVVFQHPQPALLYLVPYCLISLICAAILNGEVKDVISYKEDDGDVKAIDDSAAAEKKTNETAVSDEQQKPTE